MAYEVIMPYHLHMPSYFLETFTEYPYRRFGQVNPVSTVNDLIDRFSFDTPFCLSRQRVWLFWKPVSM